MGGEGRICLEECFRFFFIYSFACFLLLTSSIDCRHYHHHNDHHHHYHRDDHYVFGSIAYTLYLEQNGNYFSHTMIATIITPKIESLSVSLFFLQLEIYFLYKWRLVHVVADKFILFIFNKIVLSSSETIYWFKPAEDLLSATYPLNQMTMQLLFIYTAGICDILKCHWIWFDTHAT